MIDGNISFATALAVLMLTPEFFAPLRNLAVEYHAGQTGNAVLAQLPNFAELIPRPSSDAQRRLTLPPRPPTLRFEEVSFAYPGADHLTLDHVSFTVAAGETIVLLGPSGVGKTTVLDLLHGRLQPSAGKITINNTPLVDLDPEMWFRNITSVPQNPFMFSSSIQKNVSLSNNDASTEQIRVALKLALASDFVAELPLGIDSPIGEEGATLSGGQRQRLAIARALLRDAPLVLLDEFTAHLDPETELKLISSLRPFLQDRTAVIVAHREATLALADRVFRLENGWIEEVPR